MIRKNGRGKRRLKRLAAAGVLCCLLSGSVLTAGAEENPVPANAVAVREAEMPEGAGLAGIPEGAGSAETPEGAGLTGMSGEEGISENGGQEGTDGAPVSFTVSGADARGFAVSGTGAGGSPEEEPVLIDFSDLVYQAGGWGIPAEEMIQPYALTDTAGLESAIFNALQDGAEELDVREFGLAGSDLDTVRGLAAKVLNENPGLFYGASYLGCLYNGETIAKLRFYYGNYFREDRQAYEAKIEEAAALVTSGMSDMEKALVLHDYLAQNCSYAYSEYLAGTLTEHMDFFSAYGALAEGRAVCQGYALAYDALLQAVGIESFTCSSRVMNHAWNIIRIDGEWYHVDVTWDDPVWNTEGQAGHEYFLLSDAEMGNREHSGWSSDVACTSTKYDSFWWRDVDSQIKVSGGGQYHYVLSNRSAGTGRTGFRLLSRSGDSVSAKYSSNAVWEVWDGGGSYWQGAYTYLSCQGDTLYFNDKRNLYAMKPEDGQAQVIYTYNGGDGYLYGAMVYADGTARLNISTTPKRESDSYITVDLRGTAPVLAADYTNKTLSTTASMEYSLDNGVNWTSCTDNMKLEAFGWNGSREVPVLVRYRSGTAGGFASQAASITLQIRPGTLSGMVKCPGGRAGQTTVQILNSAGKVVYETNILSGNDSFVIQDVAAGNYTMRISRSSYVTREYPFVMGKQVTDLEAELWLRGDVNGDGRINAMDKRVIYNHMEGSALTGYEFLTGDVDGNGEINARDKRMIYNHIAGTSLLWK